MGKRGNGEGSLFRRKGGGWCGQYTVYTPRDASAGRSTARPAKRSLRSFRRLSPTVRGG